MIDFITHIDTIYIVIPFISFVAFYLKAITGTGTGTVVVSLSSFFIDPKLSVVLASLINIVGGFSMIRIDPVPLAREYWLPVAVSMTAGSILGASALRYIPPHYFQLILGVAFLMASLWFLTRSVQADTGLVRVKHKASMLDNVTGIVAGFCGGFVGVNAPILILHFSRDLDKRHLRRLLVIIFIPAAIGYTTTFALNGLLEVKVLICALLMLPTMALGIYCGNLSFTKISEVAFRRILAVFLITASLRLIWKTIF